MALNQKIVEFAREKLGKKVGDGECWTLANNAVSSAGGVTPSGSGNSLYVWGRQVDLPALQPGNIIQFTRYRVRVEESNGAWREYTRGAPRHTAIVERVRANGEVVVLEANVDATKRVRRNTLYFRSGTFGGRTVTVSGSAVFYQVVGR